MAESFLENNRNHRRAFSEWIWIYRRKLNLMTTVVNRRHRPAMKTRCAPYVTKTMPAGTCSAPCHVGTGKEKKPQSLCMYWRLGFSCSHRSNLLCCFVQLPHGVHRQVAIHQVLSLPALQAWLQRQELQLMPARSSDTISGLPDRSNVSPINYANYYTLDHDITSLLLDTLAIRIHKEFRIKCTT